MNTIPSIATVADVQRGYRTLVNTIKKNGEPLIVVNNGKPDAVILDVKKYNEYMQRLGELEKERLLRLSREAIEEYKKGKTVRMKKGETLMELLKRVHDH